MLTLTGEQDDDGKDETDEAEGSDEADKPHLVVSLSNRVPQAYSCDYSCGERDTEEDGNTLCHSRVVHRDILACMAYDLDVEERKGREEDDLQDTVEGDQYSTVIAVAASEVCPDENHGNTAGYTNEDETFAEVCAVGEKGPG